MTKQAHIPHRAPLQSMTGRQELDRALCKLRREGYSSQPPAGVAPPASRRLFQTRNIAALEIRPKEDGWIADLVFKKRPGQVGIIRRLPFTGCYPSRAQALAEARNELRRMMFAPENSWPRRR